VKNLLTFKLFVPVNSWINVKFLILWHTYFAVLLSELTFILQMFNSLLCPMNVLVALASHGTH